MNPNVRIFAGIVLVAGFLSLVLFAAPFLGFKLDEERCEVDTLGNLISCPHEKQVQEIQAVLPLIVSFAIVVGAGTYYLMSSKVESKDKSLKKNTGTLLKMLNADESKVVNVLLENHGHALQAEITRLPGMSKVKSHRVVQKLIDRGVLIKEDFGKTNKIKFTPEIQEGLF
ncbi:MAG: hypothetical protein HY392_03385 [Candidatus Diapherotrites archaeon]|nr:hypothetical protein [Candidatus Diapherotrites archaeon]